MKSKKLIQKVVLGILLFSIFLLSMWIGLIIYINYDIVSKGLTGIAIIYLILYFGKHEKLDVTLQDIVIDPQKGRYIISVFIISMISLWAFGQIYEMILFFQNI